jgi:ketosteroid isomerase-like protein
MRRRAVVVMALAVFLGVSAWRTWWPSDERQIRQRLQAFAADFNRSTTDGLGTAARAEHFGTYFTEDVVVDLGKGSPPIEGRETLVGMAGRLQARTAAFRLELVDLTVHVSGESAAEVSLTATVKRRLSVAEESIDARELSVEMAKTDGDWRVRRVRTVDPFR